MVLVSFVMLFVCTTTYYLYSFSAFGMISESSDILLLLSYVALSTHKHTQILLGSSQATRPIAAGLMMVQTLYFYLKISDQH